MLSDSWKLKHDTQNMEHHHWQCTKGTRGHTLVTHLWTRPRLLVFGRTPKLRSRGVQTNASGVLIELVPRVLPLADTHAYHHDMYRPRGQFMMS